MCFGEEIVENFWNQTTYTYKSPKQIFFFFFCRQTMDARSKKQGNDSCIKCQYWVCKDQTPWALSGTKIIESQEQSNGPTPPAPFSSVLNSCSSRADTRPLTHSHPQTNTHHRRGHLFTPTHTCPQSPVTAWFGQLFSEHISEPESQHQKAFLSKVSHCSMEA